MTRPRSRALLAAALAVASTAIAARGFQGEKPKYGYQDTPLLPGGKWHVHDGTRPLPTVVTPGTWSTAEAAGKAPSDAVVLFDGADLSHWTANGKPAGWKLEDGAMVVTGPNVAGGGAISSKEQFGDCQIHVEFATPNPPKGRDQGRGNSGILIMGRYEFQLLDTFENPTYADGHAGAVYGQHPPMVNASRKPGEWQTYDILFTAPRFKGDGTLETPAYITGLHNGVVVQNHAEVIGAVVWRDLAKYTAHEPTGPIVLQDHGDPVRFRSVWVRPLKPVE